MPYKMQNDSRQITYKWRYGPVPSLFSKIKHFGKGSGTLVGAGKLNKISY